MDKNTSVKIRKYSFAMTCAIVIYHAPSLDVRAGTTPFDAFVFKVANAAINNLGILAMCYFFFVTGFLLFNNYSLELYPQKVKRRIHSLFIPYLLWQCTITVINILQKQYVFSLRDFIHKTFLFEMWPADGALWYVYIVFLLALASPLFYYLYRSSSGLLVLIFIILIELRNICPLAAVTAITNYGYIGNVLYYLPAFVIGGYCGCYLKQKNIETILACFTSLAIITFLLNGLAEGIFYNCCVKMLPLALILIIPNSNRFNALKLYDCTFLIYAIHQPLIADIKPFIINHSQIWEALPLSCAYILVKMSFFCIVICVAMLFHWLMKRYSPSLLKLLTGGRC